MKPSDRTPPTSPRNRGKLPPGRSVAQREILRLRSNADFMAAYGDRTHPNHAIAQDQMDELYSLAYPAAVVQQ